MGWELPLVKPVKEDRDGILVASPTLVSVYAEIPGSTVSYKAHREYRSVQSRNQIGT